MRDIRNFCTFAMERDDDHSRFDGVDITFLLLLNRSMIALIRTVPVTDRRQLQLQPLGDPRLSVQRQPGQARNARSGVG